MVVVVCQRQCRVGLGGPPVEVLREGWIAVYRASAPETSTLYRRGQVAEAEPALPGWAFPVDELFD